jgi:hypothetical protein
MSDLYRKTREDWISELERELRYRQRVYARAVAERRMNARAAAWQFDTLQDLLNHLKGNPTWQPTRPTAGPTITGTMA